MPFVVCALGYPCRQRLIHKENELKTQLHQPQHGTNSEIKRSHVTRLRLSYHLNHSPASGSYPSLPSFFLSIVFLESLLSINQFHTDIFPKLQFSSSANARNKIQGKNMSCVYNLKSIGHSKRQKGFSDSSTAIMCKLCLLCKYEDLSSLAPMSKTGPDSPCL